jgi:hypothetical protein
VCRQLHAVEHWTSVSGASLCIRYPDRGSENTHGLPPTARPNLSCCLVDGGWHGVTPTSSFHHCVSGGWSARCCKNILGSESHLQGCVRCQMTAQLKVLRCDTARTYARDSLMSRCVTLACPVEARLMITCQVFYLSNPPKNLPDVLRTYSDLGPEFGILDHIISSAD